MLGSRFARHGKLLLYMPGRERHGKSALSQMPCHAAKSLFLIRKDDLTALGEWHERFPHWEEAEWKRRGRGVHGA